MPYPILWILLPFYLCYSWPSSFLFLPWRMIFHRHFSHSLKFHHHSLDDSTPVTNITPVTDCPPSPSGAMPSTSSSTTHTTRAPPLTHPMITSVKHGISKPISHLNLHTTTESLIPKSHLHALRDPNWVISLRDEFDGLISKKISKLVPGPQGANIVRYMWLFIKKYRAGGSFDKYKALLVANGKS